MSPKSTKMIDGNSGLQQWSSLIQEVKECNDRMEVVDKLAEASVGGHSAVYSKNCATS